MCMACGRSMGWKIDSRLSDDSLVSKNLEEKDGQTQLL